MIRLSILFILVVLATVCRGETDPTRNDTCGAGKTGPSNRVDTTQRVAKLREKMAASDVDAVIILTDDEHQNEYVANADEKRSYITGFSGSAGRAVVTATKQAVWTDGRYFTQAADQLDCDWWLMRSEQPGVKSLTQWIIENLPTGSKVGLNARTTPAEKWMSYEKTFFAEGIELRKVDDLVGQVWNEMGGRPAAENNEVYSLNTTFSGRSWGDKVNDMRTILKNSRVDIVIVSALDEIAWLYNLRGSDIAYNPVFFAYAAIDSTQNVPPKLFLRGKTTRLTSQLQQHLNCNADGSCDSETNCVNVLEYGDIDSFISTNSNSNKTLWLSTRTNYALYSLARKELIRRNGPSPLLLPKAIKNSVERQGMRDAHLRDSAVIAEFIARLEKEIDQGVSWTEVKVAQEIDNLRIQQKYNKGLSFNTIAGSGRNGAIIHYSPTNETNYPVNKTSMLLLDSGGQYLDGTTDITRTFHFGTPTAFQKKAYTLVLQGVIDLAMMKFPANRTLGSSLDVQARKYLWRQGLNYNHGTGHGIGMFLNIHEGSSLDTLARRPMWGYGLDFGHSTGHGIGMFLNVHEGPARIAQARESLGGSTERYIYDGMFFSDEPGYYDTEKGFGVRLETIVMAAYTDTQYASDTSYLTFESIALIPFEKKLINLDMLNREQREWLNTYHEKCRTSTGKYLKDNGKTDAYNWIMERVGAVPLDDTTGGSSLVHGTPYIMIIVTIFYYLM